MTQIMQIKIELAKKEKGFKEAKLQMKRKFAELQSFIKPYFTDDEIKFIQADAIEQVGDEIQALKSELLEMQQDIEQIKRDLGV